MESAKLSKLEHRMMASLWEKGALSVREVQELFPEKSRPAYATVQTVMYRLEAKGAVRRIGKVGNAHVFEAVLSERAAERRVIEELLSFFGGRSQPVMAHLIEVGGLTAEDIDAARQLVRRRRHERTKR